MARLIYWVMNVLLFEYENNQFTENKEIINISLNECPICCFEREYFVEFKCNQEHLICIECLENVDECYFCRTRGVVYEKLYVNKKN